MTTRRNSSRGFGLIDSDERRRSRGGRQALGRSQNRDEFESDYEDYDDEDAEEDQGNRYMRSRRNRDEWDEDDSDYNNGNRNISPSRNLRGENDYQDYDDPGVWEVPARYQSRAYGYEDDDDYDRNSGSSYSRRGFGSMTGMRSGFGRSSGANYGYGNGRRRNRSSGRYGDSGSNWGSGSREGRSRSHSSFSDDQYLGRGQSRRFDDDHGRYERGGRSGNSRMRRSSAGFPGRRSTGSGNW